MQGLYTYYYEGENGYYTINYNNDIPINKEMKLYDNSGTWLVTYDCETFDVIPTIPTKDDCKIYFYEGEQRQYYTMNGVQLTLDMNKQKVFGDWYVIGCQILNYSQKPFDFIFDKSSAEFIDKKGKVKTSEILSHKEYIAKVEKNKTNLLFGIILWEAWLRQLPE